jgi:hypothetical protein
MVNMIEQKKDQAAGKYADAIKLIRQVLSQPPGKEGIHGFLWQDIASAMSEIIAVRSPETEDILIKLLEFKGTIPLAPESNQTSAMSPENALRSIAIRQLSEWTGKKYLARFKKIQSSTESPVLRSIAQVVIDRHSRKAKRPSRHKRPVD